MLELLLPARQPKSIYPEHVSLTRNSFFLSTKGILRSSRLSHAFHTEREKGILLLLLVLVRSLEWCWKACSEEKWWKVAWIAATQLLSAKKSALREIYSNFQRGGTRSLSHRARARKEFKTLIKSTTTSGRNPGRGDGEGGKSTFVFAGKWSHSLGERLTKWEKSAFQK